MSDCYGPGDECTPRQEPIRYAIQDRNGSEPVEYVLASDYDAVLARVQELEQIRELLGCHRAYITATIQDMLIKAEQQAGEIERLNANQRRQPTENETVCHACDGSGWVDR